LLASAVAGLIPTITIAALEHACPTCDRTVRPSLARPQCLQDTFDRMATRSRK
jgi:hypothetical protein